MTQRNTKNKQDDMSDDSLSAAGELPSQYDHEGAQRRWYKVWEQRGYFHAEPGAKDAAGNVKPPYTIVIPPPNVTGALHLGHALNNTLQDILIRMKRMQGFNALWMPGTDHAGIATQAVVERRLLEEQKLSRHDLGREGLIEKIWEWKAQYEKRIIGQLKQIGCSCDWERLRFTLDETCARAVRETFFNLFKDGKIYRGKRLVNWDTYLQTAVSDDEVFKEPVKGHFWHFKYPVVKDAKWKKGEPGVRHHRHDASRDDARRHGRSSSPRPRGGLRQSPSRTPRKNVSRDRQGARPPQRTSRPPA